MSHYKRYTDTLKDLLEGRKNKTITEDEEDKLLDNLADWWYILTPLEQKETEVFRDRIEELLEMEELDE
jgi:hypothetical protein